MALGLVRAAQRRDDEAEALLRSAADQAADLAPAWIHELVLSHLAEFLETRGRHEEAAALDERIGRRGDGWGAVANPTNPI